jgi:hypothetical protein
VAVKSSLDELVLFESEINLVQKSRWEQIMLGLDPRAARYTWTVVSILLSLVLIYLIRETLFIFVVALLFAYLLWPLVKFLDQRAPGRSKVWALALVYLSSLLSKLAEDVPRII